MSGKYLLSLLDYFVFLLVVFVALFAMSFLSINEENKKGNVTEKAEFIIEMTWRDGSENDIDLWVAGPEGNIVFFGHKDGKFIVLDRDDVGINNTMITPQGIMTNKTRREVATIRKILPGTYTVNVMMFRNRDGQTERPKITIRQLNPYREVVEKEVELTEDGEEQTILTFDLDEKGNITNKSEDYISLFQKAP